MRARSSGVQFVTQLAIKKLNSSDDFLTPPEIVQAMGDFDLDPCASHRQQMRLAGKEYRFPEDNGLLLQWHGSAFVNPPFSELQAWINRFILHGNGVLLVPARVEVSWFWKLWHHADSIFFTKGPVKYLCPEGKAPPRFFGGAFCAMGAENVQRLQRIPLKGVLITSRTIREDK
jgi:hypothetical protein